MAAGRHDARTLGEKCFHRDEPFLVQHEFDARRLGRDFLRQIVHRRPQTAVDDHRVGAFARQHEGGKQAVAVIAHGGFLRHRQAKILQLLRDVTEIGVDDFAGEDLIERLQQIQPALKGIVSSGYPYQPRSADVGFLQKPYLPGMLADALNQVLVVR